MVDGLLPSSLQASVMPIGVYLAASHVPLAMNDNKAMIVSHFSWRDARVCGIPSKVNVLMVVVGCEVGVWFSIVSKCQ